MFVPDKLVANTVFPNVPPLTLETKSVAGVTFSSISAITSRSVGLACVAIASTLDKLCVAIVPNPDFRIFLVADEYAAEAEPEAIAKTLDKLCLAIVPKLVANISP